VLARLWNKLKSLWLLARTERATPREVFWAVFVGAFMGCTPAIGIHGGLAVGAATLFRKNRLFAWLGSRVSNVLVLPFIVYAEVQVAHRLRAGTWAALSFERERVVAQAGELLLDWCLGSVPVGAAIGALAGLLAWAWARRRTVTPSRDELPRPSSECAP
jgi:uncharacterized protein (DUF2062 family)